MLTAIRLILIAALALAFAVFYWNVSAAEPIPAQSNLTCAHYTAIGQAYKCGSV